MCSTETKRSNKGEQLMDYREEMKQLRDYLNEQGYKYYVLVSAL